MTAHADMVKNSIIKPENDELLIMLMTRVGMIMEDISVVALDARSAGLHDRVNVVADAATKIATLSAAARALSYE
jgi:hypothetical protein